MAITAVEGAPIAVVDPDPQWATHFNASAGRIRVIDIALTVEDSSNEAAYVPALERIVGHASMTSKSSGGMSCAACSVGCPSGGCHPTR